MKVDALSSLTGGNMQSGPPPQFTDVEKRDELARECNLRKSVYPGMVRQGRMTQAQAERQKAIMYAIWLDYCARVNADKTQPQAALDLSVATSFAPSTQPEVIGVDPGAGDDRTVEMTVDVGSIKTVDTDDALTITETSVESGSLSE